LTSAAAVVKRTRRFCRHCHAEAGQKMGLASPAIADEQDWFRAIDVAALGEIAHLCRSHQWRLCVVEFLERFYSWQVRFFDPPLYGIPLPLFNLGRQQNFQIPGVCFLLPYCLLSQSTELRRHHRHAQRFTVLLDGGLLELRQLAVHLVPPATSSWSYSFITGKGR
jgi:hypothetical protein